MQQILQPANELLESSNHNSQVLRLLSFNIQVGIQTRHFSEYITSSWRHMLPYPKRMQNLHKIAHIIKNYDLVALQEADGGSIRSNYINQVEFLANYAGFPYWFHQCNRNLGKIAQHSNGLLAKIPVSKVKKHKLPGLIPGRGAIEAVIGQGNHKLSIIVAHLALSSRARNQQINYLSKVVADSQHVIIMGDLNCNYQQLKTQFHNNGLDLITPDNVNMATFPSWKPKRQYDHILVSPSLTVIKHEVLPCSISDHLPIALEVLLPDSILGSVDKQKSSSSRYHPVRLSNELIHNE